MKWGLYDCDVTDMLHEVKSFFFLIYFLLLCSKVLNNIITPHNSTILSASSHSLISVTKTKRF